jgi:predicted acyl esterase
LACSPDRALITSGITRLSYRSGTERTEPVPIGRPFPVDIRFSNFAAYRLFRGDRLRLIVMTGPKFDFERNMNDGGESRFEALEQARVGPLDLLMGGNWPNAFFRNLRAAR